MQERVDSRSDTRSMFGKSERRNKLQIYRDILSAIYETTMSEGIAKPTRVQQLSNLSYDRLSFYLNQLEAKKMIHIGDTLSLTEEAHAFLKDYQKAKELFERMGLE